jgi:hypothetical protein
MMVTSGEETAMSGRMWGNALVAVAACSALAFGVVAVNSAPDPAAPESVTATSTERPYYDEHFMAALGANVNSVSRPVALGMGHRACTAFGEGASAAEIRRILVQKGLTEAQASRVILAAVSTFCPDYKFKANP